MACLTPLNQFKTTNISEYILHAKHHAPLILQMWVKPKVWLKFLLFFFSHTFTGPLALVFTVHDRKHYFMT